mgnify:CR=1 FL=1
MQTIIRAALACSVLCSLPACADLQTAQSVKTSDRCPAIPRDLVAETQRKPTIKGRAGIEVAGWLVDLYGDVPRLEMFSRTSRPGWDSLGDEIGKFPSVA